MSEIASEPGDNTQEQNTSTSQDKESEVSISKQKLIDAQQTDAQIVAEVRNNTILLFKHLT